tara:strand:- start:2553 stop:4409 length:1857 start_codon:yes stop_codon:yes gene_type:complete
MCGIIGANAARDVSDILICGLEKMEYRGYDSAGVAVVHNEMITRVRKVGKVENLKSGVKKIDLLGSIGLAHTRWATHGDPTELNAHPFISNDEIIVVHNGIIENYIELKKMLIDYNYKFTSDTDTEVIAHLLHYLYKKNIKNNLENNTIALLLKTLKDFSEVAKGAYALGLWFAYDKDNLYAIRKGSPLILGCGIGENFIASDILALLPVTNKFVYLEENDIAVISKKNYKIYDFSLNDITKLRIPKLSSIESSSYNLGDYRHYMQKEIFEQPESVSNTINYFLSDTNLDGFVKFHKFSDKIKCIQIVACGSSYNAAILSKYIIEKELEIPCFVDIASEFRVKKPVVLDNSLFLTISQSGETADTLAALRLAKEHNYLVTAVICNVPESSLVRESDVVFYTKAGVEVGVASTKAFVTQLLTLLILVEYLKQKNINDNKLKLEKSLFKFQKLAFYIEQTLKLDKTIAKIAKDFVNKEHALFLGRNIMSPIAAEGALKLKEISYIHAESYAAGELKHGPLALVDSNMPVVALVPNDNLLPKMLSNLEEVQARGGEIFILTDKSDLSLAKKAKVIHMPSVEQLFLPIIYTIPLQLLAYHVAILRGTDVDKPRNLAKSVTVE